MKVTAVSALYQAKGKVHMNVAMEQIGANRNGTQQAANPTSTKIELGPTAAARLLSSDALDAYAILTPSSSSSIAAQNSNINLLSEPDAVAQEMSSNLRPSMSQSGEALLDITMPDNPIGTSASALEEKKEANIPLALRNLEEQLVEFYEGPNKWVQKVTEYTDLDKTYVLPPTRTNAPQQDIGMVESPADFVYVPNRTQERPPNITPDDVPYTEVPKRVSELKPIADGKGVLPTTQALEILREQESLRTPKVPRQDIHPEQTQYASFDSDNLEVRNQNQPLRDTVTKEHNPADAQALDAMLKQFHLSFN